MFKPYPPSSNLKTSRCKTSLSKTLQHNTIVIENRMPHLILMMMVQWSSSKSHQQQKNLSKKAMKRPINISTIKLRMSRALTSVQHLHRRNGTRVSTHAISTFLKSISKRNMMLFKPAEILTPLLETHHYQFQLLILAKGHPQMRVGMRSDQKHSKICTIYSRTLALNSKERVGINLPAKLQRQVYLFLRARRKQPLDSQKKHLMRPKIQTC